MKHSTPEFRAAAVEKVRANGNRIWETARQIGIKGPTLQVWCKAAGIKGARERTPAPPPDKPGPDAYLPYPQEEAEDAIRRVQEAGGHVRQVAVDMGIRPSIIERWCRLNGVKLAKPIPINNQERNQRWAEEITSGRETYRSLAVKEGRSVGTITAAVRGRV